MQIVIIDTVNACRSIAVVQAWVYQNVLTGKWQYIRDSSEVIVAKVKA